MKTIRRPKYRNKTWISAWIALVILLAIVLIDFGSPTIALPFMKVGGYVGNAGADTFSLFTSKSSLETENRQLKNQLAEIQVAVDRDKLLTQENSDLKELLGRFSKSSSILAIVISKPPMSLYDTVVVDVGSSDNVSEGDVVLALGYVPIGTVNSVYLHTATVQLYSSYGQKIDVRIGKDIQASAEAQGGGNFLIKLPKGTLVAEGDPIAAPGINANIFGHVENIETTDNDPFTYVRFSLPINMSELHFLQIDRALSS